MKLHNFADGIRSIIIPAQANVPNAFSVFDQQGVSSDNYNYLSTTTIITYFFLKKIANRPYFYPPFCY